MANVSLRLQSLLESLPRVSTPPAAAAAPAPAPVTPPAPPPANPLANDVFERESGNAGFNKESRSIAQPTGNDCGLAALASVNSATAGNQSDEQLLDLVHDNATALNHEPRQAFHDSVDLGNGTTPQELGMLLGQQGQEVTRSFGQFDAEALKKSTESGEVGMLMVDANALHNATDGQKDGTRKPEGQGDLHWLTVDAVKESGKDGKEQTYRVKDSAGQREYTLSRSQLENMVNQARDGVHHSGGGITVKNRPNLTKQEDRFSLSQGNLDQTSVDKLGAGDGIGRNNKLSVLSS